MDEADGVEPAGGAEAPQYPPAVLQLCSRLYRWTCANCTCPNSIAHPTADMLAYCSALGARMAAQSEVSLARARHTAATNAYIERVKAWAASGRSAAGSSGGGGGGMPWENARGGAAPSASAGASGGAPQGPRPTPIEAPDFAAMLEALPSVPEPPSVPPALLAQQVCEDCEAPFLRASASVNTATGAVAPPTHVAALAQAMGPNLDLLTSTLMHSVGAEEEEEGEEASASGSPALDEGTVLDDDSGEVAARAAAGGSGSSGSGEGEDGAAEDGITAALAQVRVRRSVTSYLLECGVSHRGVSTALQGVLSGCRGCSSTEHAHPTPAAAASGTAAALQARAADAAAAAPPHPRRRPALPAPPRLVVAFDQRMLLHEAKGDRGGARLPVFDGPPVRLPPPPPRPHPERPDRLRAIAQHLFAQGLLQQCTFLPPRLAQVSELETVHTAAHCRLQLQALPAFFRAQAAAAAAVGTGEALLDALAGMSAPQPPATHHMFDSDTYANVYTGEAALLAAGGVLACVEAVVKGRADRGLALVRPPGHHADAEKSQGFCIYNNVAVAAAVARREWGVRRVAIVDWDVHHGNGACLARARARMGVSLCLHCFSPPPPPTLPLCHLFSLRLCLHSHPLQARRTCFLQTPLCSTFPCTATLAGSFTLAQATPRAWARGLAWATM